MIHTLCTAIIKTHIRPKNLFLLVDSIRKYYPDLPVIIVDDSRQPLDYQWDSLTEYHHVAYDVGTSEGRNIAVNFVKTPYTLLLDDDFLFWKGTNIEKMLYYIQNHNFDFAGGSLLNYGIKPVNYKGFFGISDDTKLIINTLSTKTGTTDLDFIANFFLTKTDILRKFPWDKNLRLSEHAEFFWQLKQKTKVRIAHVDKVSVIHIPCYFRSKEYAKMRSIRLDHFRNLMLKKNGFTGIKYIGGKNDSKSLIQKFCIWLALLFPALRGTRFNLWLLRSMAVFFNR